MDRLTAEKRIEELVNPSKIIRPAYENVQPRHEYKTMDER